MAVKTLINPCLNIGETAETLVGGRAEERENISYSCINAEERKFVFGGVNRKVRGRRPTP